jgi:hypothetical protein
VLTTTGYDNYREKIHGTEGTALISEQHRWANGSSHVVAEFDMLEERKPHWENAEADGVLVAGTQPAWHSAGGLRGAYDFPPLAKEVDEKIPHQHHLENFFDTVGRGGKQTDLTCPAEEAFKTCVAVFAINDAVREQRRIELKPEDYTVS